MSYQEHLDELSDPIDILTFALAIIARMVPPYPLDALLQKLLVKAIEKTIKILERENNVTV